MPSVEIMTVFKFVTEYFTYPLFYSCFKCWLHSSTLQSILCPQLGQHNGICSISSLQSAMYSLQLGLGHIQQFTSLAPLSVPLQYKSFLVSVYIFGSLGISYSSTGKNNVTLLNSLSFALWIWDLSKTTVFSLNSHACLYSFIILPLPWFRQWSPCYYFNRLFLPF